MLALAACKPVRMFTPRSRRDDHSRPAGCCVRRIGKGDVELPRSRFGGLGGDLPGRSVRHLRLGDSARLDARTRRGEAMIAAVFDRRQGESSSDRKGYEPIHSQESTWREH